MSGLRRASPVLLAAVLAACGPGATPRPGSPEPAAPTPSGPSGEPSASPPPSPASPVPSGPTYTNPVYAGDFPDPHVILVGETYYAYSTNSGTSNVPTIRSTDLVTWERVGDAMPALPRWSPPNFGNTWAPGVIQLGERFVLYFVARDAASNRQCIGVATSEAPEGPFRDALDRPLVCQVDLGGSIDPYPFRDADGRLYLFWKNDGNCCGKPVGLWVQPLADDGLALTGEPVEVLRRDQAWEIPLIENPAMVLDAGRYYLFYSGNWWESLDYAVGYAVCETVIGPCEKPLDEPLFKYTAEVMGPGGQAFFVDRKGNLWMAYHAWTGPNVGYPGGARSLRIEPVRFEDGRPLIPGPTSTPQPLP
ncbi:MAG TPA: glycoside hydrolase family 43 protein [Candidatus Limnocylindrales bacterium]|nr:glycoside hydrolase family 43 protein [Candidatus Limnocylindrales bacterium]